jgi:hypothetical protein
MSHLVKTVIAVVDVSGEILANRKRLEAGGAPPRAAGSR